MGAIAERSQSDSRAIPERFPRLCRTWSPAGTRRCSHWRRPRRRLRAGTCDPRNRHHPPRSVCRCNPASTRIWKEPTSLSMAPFHIGSSSWHRQPSTCRVWGGEMSAITPGSIELSSCRRKGSGSSWLAALEVLQSLKFKSSKAPSSYSFSWVCGEGWPPGRLPVVLKMTMPSLPFQTQGVIFWKGSGSDAPDSDFANACTLLGVWGWPCAATQSTGRVCLPNGNNLQTSHKTQQTQRERPNFETTACFPLIYKAKCCCNNGKLSLQPILCHGDTAPAAVGWHRS